MTESAASRCPFPMAIGLFAVVSVLFPAGLFFWGALPAWGLHVLQLLGVTAFAVWLESRRAHGISCPWLEVGASRRLLMYGALWLVGLLVLLPIGAMDMAPLPVVCVLAALVVVPAIALLRQHVIVDHGDLEEAGVPWWLFASARLPVYFLMLLGLLVVVGGLLSLLPWRHAS
jgi:hypothetical protein